MSASSQQQQLPIIISGAGPCGLVVALTLQQKGIPFILLERAQRNRFCSDVGSGFDLAPTAVDILKNRLKVPGIDRIFKAHAGMHMNDMNGKVVREVKLTGLKIPFDFVSVSRSDLQTTLLNALTTNRKEEDVDAFFRCGMEVEGYKENKDNTSVSINLSDGTSIQGSALLACDGIHSRVRKCMLEKEEENNEKGNKLYNDELRFCNTTCYWGKTAVKDGSDLQRAIEATQRYKSEGTSFVWSLGTHKEPGSFMVAPLRGNTLAWAFFTKSVTPPTKSNDLVRRAGSTLEEKDRIVLETIASKRFDLMKLVIQETDRSSITRVGLFDRDNKIPFSSGSIALLGDAAHPQSPFMGQGVNMAITDAYVCATLLTRATKQQSSGAVAIALETYNNNARRKSVQKVVKQARQYGNLCVSKNRFTCWVFRKIMHWAPLSFILSDMMKGDESNHDFVHTILDRQ